MRYTNSQKSIGSSEKIHTDGRIGSNNSIRYTTEVKSPEILTDRGLSKSPVRVVRKPAVISPE